MGHHTNSTTPCGQAAEAARMEKQGRQICVVRGNLRHKSKDHNSVANTLQNGQRPVTTALGD